MTLLYVEPFDIYNTIANFSGIGGWAFRGAFGTTGSSSISAGRYGGQMLTLFQGNSSGAGYSQALPANHATLVIGCAIKFGTSSSVGQNVIQFMDGSTIQTDLRYDTAGKLYVTRNGTTLATATGGLSPNTWYYVELKVTFHGTAGAYAVRLNGTTVPGILDATNVNTIGTANPFANTIGIADGFTAVNPGQLVVDDLYVCDDQGSVNNTFLGDVELRTILPTGAGSNSAFTQIGGSGGGNYTSVNENPNNADTSYVTGNSVGVVDTYVYASLPTNTANVLAVVATPVARKNAAGNRHITGRFRSGGGSEADFTAPDVTLSASYALTRQIQELNPVTAVAWAPSDLSGELGTRVSV